MRTFALGSRVALACCLAMQVLLTTFLASSVSAQEVTAVGRRMFFDLPAQPLESALSDFGTRTGHSVLVDSAMTQGKTTRAVRGEFEPQEALRQLLQGTGLLAHYSGRQAFTLQPEALKSLSDLPSLPAANDAQASEEHGVPSFAGVPAPAAADFSGALQAAMTRVMCATQPGAFGRYRVALQLWLDAEGRVTRASLLESSGVKARDAQLLAQLKGLDIGHAPPPALVQPLTVLLSPRPDPVAACRKALPGSD